MEKLIIILCCLVVLLFTDCTTETKSEKKIDKTIIELGDKCPESIMDMYLEGEYDFQIIVGEKILVTYFVGGKVYNLFIKEIGCHSSGQIFHIILKDNWLYSVPKYPEKEEDIRHYNKMQYDSISNYLALIPELRTKDTLFQNEFLRMKDIKNIEEIINNFELMLNENGDSNEVIEIIKHLLICTQVAPVNVNSTNFDNNRFLNYVFNKNSVVFLSSQEDYSKFVERISDLEEDLNNKSFFNWSNGNFKFLRNKLNLIEAEYSKPNIYYAYTKKDMKVFRFEIILDDNKVKLKKEHINREYAWLNAETFVPRISYY